MWSHLIKIVSLGKGALVIGVAASAAMVSSAEFSTVPSHQELPSATPITSAAPATLHPTHSPSSSTPPNASEVPAVHQPASASPSQPSTSPKANASAKPELSGLVKECLTKYTALRAAGEQASQGDRESTTAVCKAAIEQSGLTSGEFAAKYGFDKLPAPATTTPKKTEPKTAGLEATIRQCLKDWRNYAEQTSAACARALAASGLPAEDFWKKFEEWATQQPEDTDTTTDVTAIVKDCFAKYTAHDPGAGEACKNAIAASGLSSNDFFAKYGTPARPSTEPKPTASPKSPTSDATYQLIAYCIKLRNALTSTSEQERVNAVSQACAKAIATTGLSSIDFWTKFGKELTNNPYTAKPSATPGPSASPKPVTSTAELARLVASCLELYKAITSTGDTRAASEACRAAISASGLSSTDFWAKYHPTTN